MVKSMIYDISLIKMKSNIKFIDLVKYITRNILYLLYDVNPSASGYIFRFTFRFLSDVSYSNECQTKRNFSTCLKNIPAFSSYSEVL